MSKKINLSLQGFLFMFEYGIRRAALYHTTIGPGSNFIQYAHTHTHTQRESNTSAGCCCYYSCIHRLLNIYIYKKKVNFAVGKTSADERLIIYTAAAARHPAAVKEKLIDFCAAAAVWQQQHFLLALYIRFLLLWYML